jgi:hypothetical protein
MLIQGSATPEVAPASSGQEDLTPPSPRGAVKEFTYCDKERIKLRGLFQVRTGSPPPPVRPGSATLHVPPAGSRGLDRLTDSSRGGKE